MVNLYQSMPHSHIYEIINTSNKICKHANKARREGIHCTVYVEGNIYIVHLTASNKHFTLDIIPGNRTCKMEEVDTMQNQTLNMHKYFQFNYISYSCRFFEYMHHVRIMTY